MRKVSKMNRPRRHLAHYSLGTDRLAFLSTKDPLGAASFRDFTTPLPSGSFAPG